MSDTNTDPTNPHDTTPTPDAAALAAMPDSPQTETETETETPSTSSGNREAAKYRRQLRDTETERDQYREQVSSLRQTLALEHAQGSIQVHAGGSIQLNAGSSVPSTETRPTSLRNPEDLFTIGKVSVDDLFTAEGRFDPEAFQAAASALYEQRPELFTRARVVVPREGSLVAPSTGSGFAAAFQPKDR